MCVGGPAGCVVCVCVWPETTPLRGGLQLYCLGKRALTPMPRALERAQGQAGRGDAKHWPQYCLDCSCTADQAELQQQTAGAFPALGYLNSLLA